ncbi:TOBE domain-containing protein [uncultured Stenotrophomonas sp.]|uniref:TOBE domain-containing protein n=1 Tax=uncultured Stenotrophomonas sp. TaxID=165438 RepID=UPI0025D635F9|nr:TOBE domain-containing protein [uncultured Stenotrophomonas sp.]
MSETDPMLELQGSLWLNVAGQSLGGRGRFALLGFIDACGSISQAAKRMGMTYKNAWDAVDAMNTAAGEPLVARSVGGRGGGGAQLTERGRQLVARFEQLERAHRAFLQSQQVPAGLDEDMALIRRIGMITSARNQFYGRISAVAAGAVNDEVQIEVAPGLTVVATITHGSMESLGLEVGMPAYALIKASSVLLAQGQGTRCSARNQFSGTVARITEGAVNDEVVVDIGHGCSVVAVITRAGTAALELEEGGPAVVLFNASSVIVGVSM